MTRTIKLTRGISALVLLTALLVAVPWALWHYVGWPLPHGLPSWSQFTTALNQHGIPDGVLLKALACVVWISWAVLATSVLIEVPAAVRGRTARRLAIIGPLQPLVGHLVAAVLVAALAVLPRPAGDSPSRLSANLPYGRPRQPAVALALVSDATAASTSPAINGFFPTAATPVPVTYVVQRGDTLWGIAQRQLGDPLRWRDIFALNDGRPQPDGRVLTDPNWIYPGWTLLLPATTTPTPTPAPTPPSPAPSSPPAPPPASTTPANPTTGAPPTPSIPAPAAPSPTTHGHNAAPSGPIGNAPRPTDHSGAAVRLPSGSVVAGSFAAGVLSAVALGRLRRRHAYRYRPPQPGRDLASATLGPTLRHLSRAAAANSGEPEIREPEPVSAGPFDDDERRQHPANLEIGIRHGDPVSVDVTDLSGVAICGPTADAITRAVVAGLLVRAGPHAAEVLLTTALAERLLPGLPADSAVRRAATADDAARAVEAERIARTRRLHAVDAPDAARFREENPENPLPLLLVLLDPLAPESLERWTALLTDAPRLGMALIFLDQSPAATGRLTVDASRTVTDAEPPVLAQRLGGTHLYGLRADEAVELLGSVSDAHRQGDADDSAAESEAAEQFAVAHRGADFEPAPSTTASTDEPWPEVITEEAEEHTERPLVVQVLGPPRITAFGEPVTTGLRARAKTLLGWYLLRPEGATIDQAVDALWPDTPPDRVLKQFWYALGDLRSFFHGPTDETLDVLEKVGEHYRPRAAEIACDLWDFQAALAEAARTHDDDVARQALRRAVDAYRGDLMAGADHPWVEPVRQDLHRRALDAHLRLAELEDQTGHPDAAVDTLERVIDLDRYAEEPYRRLMALHHEHGRPDGVTATWQLLQRRLADLDVDVDEATARLYRMLTTTDAKPSSGPSMRLSS